MERIRRVAGFLIGAVAEDFFVTALFIPAVAVVVTIVLGIVADLDGWSIFGIATASGITASGIVVIVRAAYAFFRSPAIELSHRQRRDAWVQLHVKNNRRTQRFTASVLSIEGVEADSAEEPTYPWPMKWRGWPADENADLIPIGEERIIDLAKASPPESEAPGIPIESWTNGAFTFFSKTMPEGLPPYPLGSIASYQDNFVKVMTVRVMISTISGAAESPTHTATFRVHVGFGPPTTAFTQNAVRVEIDHE